VAFYYIPSFAQTQIGLPLAASTNVLIMLNGVGVVGRILPNLLSDLYFGPLNTLVPVCLMCSLLTYLWAIVAGTAELYTWTAIYGIFGAGIQSLFPATLSSLTTNPMMQGTRMGMAFTVVSFSVLTGPPIAGVLIGINGGKYLLAQCFSGSVLVVGCLFLAAARYIRGRGKGKTWIKM
jgi:hypothetical protein